MQATLVGSIPNIPSDVAAFAADQAASAFLPSVLGLARRIFPSAFMSVRLEEDAELENDWHIVIEVDAIALSVPELVACQSQWTREIFHHCPATHVCLFRLRMV